MLFFSALFCLLSPSVAYWGVIPEEREIIVLRHYSGEVARVALDIQTASIGRLELRLEERSGVVPAGLHRHDYGEEGLRYQAVNTHCHYSGAASNDPSITAAFSDCSGRFRGRILTQDGTWYVVFEAGNYVLFHHSSIPVPEFMMGADYSSITADTAATPRFKRNVEKVGERGLASKTLEMVVVTDRAMWQFFGTKIEHVEEFALATVYKLDEIYRQYGIKVALVGMQSWRTKDLITVEKVPSDTLKNFNVYRQEKLLNIYPQHDISVLMTGVDFDGVIIGYAGVGNMCRASACNINYNSRNVTAFYASVIAHEIGHNFGIYHDTEECRCTDSKGESSRSCIMSSSLSVAVRTFSNCSLSVLREFSGTCLDNQPTVLFEDPVCGNGFVEEGEECDCGTPEECAMGDPCCEPEGCKLKLEAECYSGECCDKCKFKSYKKVCREVSSECDLVEYCTGTSSQCPTNRYKQDGSDCGAGAGFCNYGSCLVRDPQCQAIWGPAAVNAIDECYETFNKRGEAFGNCGSLDVAGENNYIACTGLDIQCGKLFCNAPKGSRPRITGVATSIQYFKLDIHLPPTHPNYTCYSVLPSSRQQAENSDVGMVYDGTKCSDNSWCMSGQCVLFEKVTCPSPGGVECGGHGACNDLNQCHCDSGYDPQFNCAVLLPVAGWNIKKILLVVFCLVLGVLPLTIVILLILRRYNSRVREFLDDHSGIRFTAHLRTLSRSTASSLRRRYYSNRDTGTSNSGGTGAGPTNSYQKLTPARPAPPRPISSYETPTTVQKTPNVLKSSTSRDLVKLEISQPEAPRKLVDDSVLDERTFAGSPLRDIGGHHS